MGVISIKVIIAEKPSVAKNIADALKIKTRQDGYFEGNGYIVTWAFGHLLQLYDVKDYDENKATWAMENFPFIPEEFKYKVKVNPKDRSKSDPGAKKQIKIIKELINRKDVDSIISSTDFDREGEVIASCLLDFLKVKKPIYRLLLNEWTPAEVLKGLDNLVPISDMEGLKDSGISRQWADWVIGINLTSVTTLKYQSGKGSPLNVGRVMLPTMKIIYDRCKEIERFKPEDYYKLSVTFKTKDDKEYIGWYTVEDSEDKDKFKDKNELESICEKIADKIGKIESKEVELKKEYPPYLFNLSGLQGYITSKYNGWSSDKVLNVCQKLYEKKYITYPRTASVVLEDSLVDKAKSVLEAVKRGLPYEKEIEFKKTKRVFDNSKVDGHSAIMPTYIVPDSLSEEERIVYNAIKNRFVMQFMPVSEYEETKIVTKIEGIDIPGVFISKGKVQKIEGWKKVEKSTSKDTLLPQVDKDDKVNVDSCEVSVHATTPPKLHTEKTLLRLMETCGKKVEDAEIVLSGFSIGTPATRAETISKLKSVGYIQAKGKSLVITELGEKFINTFPVKELFDLEYTGKLEKNLSDIEKKLLSKDDFLENIFNFTKKSVEKIKSDANKLIRQVGGSSESNIIGECPSCGQNVHEGANYYVCKGYKKDGQGCNMILAKKLWGANISKAEMKKILEGKKTKEFSFSMTKDGVKKNWTASLVYDKSEEKVTFAKRDVSEVTKCPSCGGKVIEGKDYYICEEYKKTCNVILPKVYLGAKFTKKDIELLLNGKFTEEKSFTIEKDGEKRVWNTKVSYDVVNRRLVFPKAERKEIGKCPKCNSSVKEGKDYYICSEYKKTCDLIIPKKTNGAVISKEDVGKLLNGEILDEKEFTWSSGKKGKARLKYGERLEFIFN